MNRGIDQTRRIADGDDTDLQNFFERPIKIAEYEWSTSVKFFQDLDPWSLYCEDTRVINRLANYNLLKANLCVKILINGNGFYYGRIIASYAPLPNADSLTQNRALIDSDMVAASQRPHVYLDPSLNQGGQMCLPFFYYYDSVNIPNSKWDDLGTLNLRELNQLRHANGSVDPITITVLAWMENVTLSVPTSRNPSTIAPQSGMESQKKKRVNVTSNGGSDEYGSGPVSGPASALSRAAGALSSVPIIGPYARATQIAAAGVSNIAKLFGFSRAPTLKPIEEYTPRYYGNLANTNVPDLSSKLTIDAKQELTVDGTVVGLDNTDEMTVKSIACRESLLDTTVWNLSDAVEQILFSAQVTPSLTHVFVPGGLDPDEWHLPACNFATVPFKFWRGSMKYRFQIVASAYHKGRIKVQWDPAGYTDTAYNTQFTHIVDISDDKDFTIEVGWGSQLGWLETASTLSSRYNLRAAHTTWDPTSMNGTITVSVVNTLTSPSASAGTVVGLNVFVSAGDDFEVAVPTDETLNTLTPLGPWSTAPAAAAAPEAPLEPQSIEMVDLDDLSLHTFAGNFDPQSGMEVEAVQTDKDDTAEPSAPVQSQVLSTFGTTLDDSDMAMSVYHGESITSFRSLLKRYAYTGFLAIGKQTNSYYVKQYLKHTPPFPGITTECTWGNALAGNFCRFTPVAYLSSAFAAQRGGMRWKATFYANNWNNNTALIGAQVEPASTVTVGVKDSFLMNLGSATVDMEEYGATVSATIAGSALTPAQMNPVVEIEIPYQTLARFSQPRRVDKTLFTTDKAFSVTALSRPAATGGCFVMHNAAAEDYSLHFFVGAPIFVDIDH